MDTKWKNVRESRWFKALCVVLSMVLAFSSVALLSAVMRVSGLYNDDAFTDPSVAKKGSLVQTTIFKAELDEIVNEIALLAGQKQLQQKAAALKKAKADSVAAALEQYKKDQATAIRKDHQESGGRGSGRTGADSGSATDCQRHPGRGGLSALFAAGKLAAQFRRRGVLQ